MKRMPDDLNVGLKRKNEMSIIMKDISFHCLIIAGIGKEMTARDFINQPRPRVAPPCH